MDLVQSTTDNVQLARSTKQDSYVATGIAWLTIKFSIVGIS